MNEHLLNTDLRRRTAAALKPALPGNDLLFEWFLSDIECELMDLGNENGQLRDEIDALKAEISELKRNGVEPDGSMPDYVRRALESMVFPKETSEVLPDEKKSTSELEVTFPDPKKVRHEMAQSKGQPSNWIPESAPKETSFVDELKVAAPVTSYRDLGPELVRSIATSLLAGCRPAQVRQDLEVPMPAVTAVQDALFHAAPTWKRLTKPLDKDALIEKVVKGWKTIPMPL